MKSPLNCMAALAASLATLPSLACAAGPERLVSPDGSITLSVSVDPDGVHYSLERKGEAILSPSRLGLNMNEPAPWGTLALAGATRRTIDQSYPMVATKATTARDHFNELTLSLREAGATGRQLNIVFRAYDDGIAFRYRIPQQPGIERVVIRDELTQFGFAADYLCWGFNIGRMDLSHEGEYDPVRSSTFRNHHHYDTPLTCRSASGQTDFVIAEADLRDYAGLYLRGRGDGLPGVQAQLAFQYEHRLAPVRRTMTAEGVQSPWRVVMMADRAGQLIPSTLIANLNPPSAIADTSWIRPGKAAWDWWSGPWLPPPAKGGTDMATMTRYIDFAGKAGLDYMLIDEGWSFGSGSGGTAPAGADVTRAKPGFDMPALVAYARARKVGLMVWVQWELLDRQMDAALAQYEAWGIKGVKVDFMDRNDQEMVDFYHRLMRKAADHRLMVDLHGAYPPTGLNRTWPNFVTQEGVMGAEYNKWSRRVTATHNVTLPFTRMLLGPLDYTPGGFRNRQPADFAVVGSPPMVQTTRGQALAMYVVYDSPLQMVADSPDAYVDARGREADGFDFVRRVPTAWDETRFVAGDIGDHVVLARRKGRDWYVGAMTNGEGRTLRVPLGFLGADSYTADIREDGADATRLVRRTAHGIDANSALLLHLAPNGGAVVRLNPTQTAGK